VDKNTLSYLFQASLGYVKPVSESIEQLYTSVADQFVVSESINARLSSLRTEVSSLVTEHTVLVETLKALIDPSSTNGFQVVPDILGVRRGDVIQTAVTGGMEPFSDIIFDDAKSAAALHVTYGKNELSRVLTITTSPDADGGNYFFRIKDASGISDLVAVHVEAPPAEPTGPLKISTLVKMPLDDGRKHVWLSDGRKPFSITRNTDETVAVVSIEGDENNSKTNPYVLVRAIGVGVTSFEVSDSRNRTQTVTVVISAPIHPPPPPGGVD
jgi:hypothetical protein